VVVIVVFEVTAKRIEAGSRRFRRTHKWGSFRAHRDAVRRRYCRSGLSFVVGVLVVAPERVRRNIIDLRVGFLFFFVAERIEVVRIILLANILFFIFMLMSMLQNSPDLSLPLKQFKL
jgi:hypothetical protein